MSPKAENTEGLCRHEIETNLMFLEAAWTTAGWPDIYDCAPELGECEKDGTRASPLVMYC